MPFLGKLRRPGTIPSRGSSKSWNGLYNREHSSLTFKPVDVPIPGTLFSG